MNNKRLSSLDRRAMLPLWVKLFAIAATLVSLLFLAMMLANIASMGHMSGMGNMHGMSGMGSSSSRSLPLWTLVSGFVTLVVVLLGFLALLAGVGGRRCMSDRQASLPVEVLPPFWRKLLLTFHMLASLAWIG